MTQLLINSLCDINSQVMNNLKDSQTRLESPLECWLRMMEKMKKTPPPTKRGLHLFLVRMVVTTKKWIRACGWNNDLISSKKAGLKGKLAAEKEEEMPATLPNVIDLTVDPDEKSLNFGENMSSLGITTKSNQYTDMEEWRIKQQPSPPKKSNKCDIIWSNSLGTGKAALEEN